MGLGRLNWRTPRDSLVSWPLPTPHSFGGFLGIPGFWMRAYRLQGRPPLGGCPVSAHPRQLCSLGETYQAEVKQGFHGQRKINTRIPHHLLYLSLLSNKETQH